MIKIIKKIYYRFFAVIDRVFPKFFISNSFFSSIYYFFLSRRFARENRAVLAGKAKHLKDSDRNNSSMYTLIRNIHRLEKGLLMKPRRDVFGLQFIGETVNNYISLFNIEDYGSNPQIKWAHDVLLEYFTVTASHPQIDKEEIKFKKATGLLDSNKKLSIPYKRIEANKPNISYDDFYKLTRYRRSVRWFLDKKVPHELIDKAILAANQSPSACNRQPYEFRVIDDPELLKTVREIPMGLRGYDHNIPMMIVVVGNLDAYFHERDRHVMYIDASLANMSLILALETLGLSSCCVNWPDIEELEVRMEKALKLEVHQRPLMCLAIGFPDPNGMVAYSEKRNLEFIRKYN